MRAMKEARSAIDTARSRTAVLVVVSLPWMFHAPVVPGVIRYWIQGGMGFWQGDEILEER